LIFKISRCWQALFALTCLGSLRAQQTINLGLNIHEESLSNNAARSGIGVSFQKEMQKHLALETGLFIGRVSYPYSLTSDRGTVSVNINESHLTIPILYEFQTKWINIDIGPAMDFLIGPRPLPFNVDGNMITPLAAPGFDLRLWCKVKIPIKLGDVFTLEPEGRINRSFSIDQTGIGMGINLRYRLSPFIALN
jgi:hypothetical protein